MSDEVTALVIIIAISVPVGVGLGLLVRSRWPEKAQAYGRWSIAAPWWLFLLFTAQFVALGWWQWVAGRQLFSAVFFAAAVLEMLWAIIVLVRSIRRRKQSV